MTKSKKVKTVKRKSKFGIAKFLVMALIFGGGLVYGIQMVQKNQENRSRATYIVYEADEYGGGTKKDCSKIGGKCGDFTFALSDGSHCKVGSIEGITSSKRCDGGSTVKCCAPENSGTETPTQTDKKSYTAKEYKLGTNKKCSSIGGKCGDFNEVPPASVSCKVDSTSGIIYTSKCDGDKTVQCCAPKGSNPTATPTLKPTIKPSPTPTKAKVRVDGFCSSKKNQCTKGSFKDVVDSKTYYIWQCVGQNGGVTRNCKIKK